MKKFLIMISILGAVIWAMDFQYFNRVAPHAIERFKQGFSVDEKLPIVKFSDRKHHTGVFDKDEEGRPVMTYFQASTSAKGNPTQTVNVAVIPVHGAIRKDAGMSSYGTKDYVSFLKKANADPNVSAIVLDIDSPGGTVDGTEEFANAIKNSQKPVVTFADGLMASAAYWAGGNADYIIANSGVTCWIGSIGTFMTHIDYSKALEKEGLKVSLITADKSTEKVLGNPYETLSAEANAQFKDEINAINDFFISQVQEARQGKLNSDQNIFTGKAFRGSEALANGLIDEIGTLENAVNKAAQLSMHSVAQDPTQKSSASGVMALPFLGALLRRKKEEATASTDTNIDDEESKKAVEEELKRLNNVIDANASMASELSQIKSENENLLKEATKTQQELQILEAKYKDLEAKYTTLGGKPSEDFTETTTDSDRIDQKNGAESNYLSSDQQELVNILTDVKQTQAHWKKMGL
jgi:signal peptide peptidase SppA